MEDLEEWAWREVERLRCETAQLAIALGEVEKELSRLAGARETMRRALRALRPDLAECAGPAAPAGAGRSGGAAPADPGSYKQKTL
ncbi:hypothetical protein, partial [Kitasatospora sp. NPDC059462]|uniref:hypothetical protein n=1 Tax=Kitasatospora sp. NPDC059462 TaxID=3346841 RepID=UPI00368B7C65